MPTYGTGFIARVLVGYVCAVLGAIALPDLQSPPVLIASASIAVALLVARRVPLFAGVLLGFVVSAAVAQDSIGHRIAPCVDGTVVELKGRVVGLPKPSAWQTQFDLAPHVIAPWPTCAGAMPQRLRLSWFSGPRVAPGELWQLRIKLRSVRGYQNPGGFDYEAWSLANHIDGGGSVRFGRRQSGVDGFSWDRLRLDLRDRIGAASLQHPGIVLALLTGDGALMSDADWALFRATGTVHLMVISGLHLTIVATAGAILGRALARLWPQRLARAGSVLPGVGCALLSVTLYACLAGWGVPVLRAWIAAVVVLIALPLGRRPSLPMVFLWIAAAVLSVDPLAPLQAGFWLSFGAVAILLAQFSPRYERASTVRALLLSQIVLAVAMVPALLVTVGSVAWVGPIANLIAVPIVSVVVVPLDLVGAGMIALLGSDANWLLHVADWVIGLVVAYLQALAGYDWLGFAADRGIGTVAISASACALMLLPLPLKHRALLLPCVLLPVVPVTADVPEREYRVTVLDVGQGLAIVIDTARHRLLFDAGPRFPSGFDLGSAVVVPNLQRAARSDVDLAILSHADMDHVGGYGAVFRSKPVRALIGGEPVGGVTALRPCRAGQAWQWDGVQFRILHPQGATASDNDSSCVLLIDNGRGRALVPGDITESSEAAVSRRIGSDPVDFLVAAHHGSRSSSSVGFVQVTQPRIVVVSAGYLNRFGHPHPRTLCRFARAGADVYLTALSGAVVWRTERPDRVVQWRARSPPYWRVGIGHGGVVLPQTHGNNVALDPCNIADRGVRRSDEP